MYCFYCGKELPTDDSKFCPSCGKQTSQLKTDETAAATEIITQDPFRHYSFATDDNFKLFIGKNEDYYINKWGKSNRPESKRSWNWSSFLAGVFWLGYRKMYLYLGLFFVLFIVIDVISNVLNISPSSSNAINFAIAFILGGYGNSFYFNHCKNKLSDIEKSNPELRKTEIIRQGGTSWGGVAIAFIGCGLYALVGYFIDSIM